VEFFEPAVAATGTSRASVIPAMRRIFIALFRREASTA
jgi:hypothetical protein